MAFTLIAHRGFSSDAPENTFAAFDLALESGFDNIELDAQLTADGVPVVIHDDALDRTTDGSGPVAKATLAEVALLDAGCRFVDAVGGTSFSGERVPTLDSVLERYAGRAHFHLELKSRDEELAPKVAALLKKHGWVEDGGGRPYGVPGVTITSFHLEQLGRSLMVLPEVRHQWLLRKLGSADVALANTLKLFGMSLHAREITDEQITRAREGGLDVRVWGVQSVDDLGQAVTMGTTGATVDWPGQARDYLAAKEDGP